MVHTPHPSCPYMCAGTLRGIVDNLKRIGDIPKDFDVDIRLMSEVGWIPGDTHAATCPHGRDFLLIPKPGPETPK